MKLYIVRHGQAELLKANEGEAKDSERALTSEGQQEASVAGQQLKAALAGESVKILASPYRRAQQTAQEIISVLGLTSDVLVTLNSVTPQHSPQEALTALQPYENESAVVLISHQPLVSHLIAQLVWGRNEPAIAMGTAYVACLSLETLEFGLAELLWVHAPKAVA